VKQQQRYEYWQDIRAVDTDNLVFLDETGMNLAMVSRYARSPRGLRAYAQQPKGRGKNLSVIGAVSLKAGFLTGVSFTGGTTGDVFLGFIETLLCPVLWPGAVVVMDNLPAHKVDGVRQAIEAVGARLIYLSPYSPDFNPIAILRTVLGVRLEKSYPPHRVQVQVKHGAPMDSLKSIVAGLLTTAGHLANRSVSFC
jgi:transposase